MGADGEEDRETEDEDAGRGGGFVVADDFDVIMAG